MYQVAERLEMEVVVKKNCINWEELSEEVSMKKVAEGGVKKNLPALFSFSTKLLVSVSCINRVQSDAPMMKIMIGLCMPRSLAKVYQNDFWLDFAYQTLKYRSYGVSISFPFISLRLILHSVVI